MGRRRGPRRSGSEIRSRGLQKFQLVLFSYNLRARAVRSEAAWCDRKPYYLLPINCSPPWASPPFLHSSLCSAVVASHRARDDRTASEQAQSIPTRLVPHRSPSHRCMPNRSLSQRATARHLWLGHNLEERRRSVRHVNGGWRAGRALAHRQRSAGKLTGAESPRLESAMQLAQPSNLSRRQRNEDSGQR